MGKRRENGLHGEEYQVGRGGGKRGRKNVKGKKAGKRGRGREEKTAWG